jgi:hypothetical protein
MVLSQSANIDDHHRKIRRDSNLDASVLRSVTKLSCRLLRNRTNGNLLKTRGFVSGVHRIPRDRRDQRGQASDVSFNRSDRSFAQIQIRCGLSHAQEAHSGGEYRQISIPSMRAGM